MVPGNYEKPIRAQRIQEDFCVIVAMIESTLGCETKSVQRNFSEPTKKKTLSNEDISDTKLS